MAISLAAHARRNRGCCWPSVRRDPAGRRSARATVSPVRDASSRTILSVSGSSMGSVKSLSSKFRDIAIVQLPHSYCIFPIRAMFGEGPAGAKEVLFGKPGSATNTGISLLIRCSLVPCVQIARFPVVGHADRRLLIRDGV